MFCIPWTIFLPSPPIIHVVSRLLFTLLMSKTINSTVKSSAKQAITGHLHLKVNASQWMLAWGYSGYSTISTGISILFRVWCSCTREGPKNAFLIGPVLLGKIIAKRWVLWGLSVYIWHPLFGSVINRVNSGVWEQETRLARPICRPPWQTNDKRYRNN